jgi:hypothetical protein
MSASSRRGPRHGGSGSASGQPRFASFSPPQQLMLLLAAATAALIADLILSTPKTPAEALAGF